jgi:redox-sensitive bicupin YhaK (pirin superfamily)
MGKVRAVGRILKSTPTIEGAGVHLKRGFGFHQVPMLDPFLLLDDFHSNNPDDYIKGFPWHPHRGIETITYMLRGEVEHGDSMGNAGIVRGGDVQWMTAGSGIIHQEMPKGEKDGSMWGFQLWANLPASQKIMKPRYREVKREEIPEITTENGTRIKIICGTAGGAEGPVRDIVTEPEYLDITVPSGARVTHRVKTGHTVFVYVIEGMGYFGEGEDPYSYEIEGAGYFDFKRERLIRPESVVVLANGDEVAALAEDTSLRVFLLSGKPIGEPVAWYGPIVMNTQDELKTAFEEYENGTFIKDKT